MIVLYELQKQILSYLTIYERVISSDIIGQSGLHYYDFTSDDFKKIEKEMRSIIKQKLDFERKVMPIDEAIEFFKDKNQDFKVELLQDLKNKGTTSIKDTGDELVEAKPGKIEEVSLYQTGDFIDLCRGPHVQNTSEIDTDGFKLTKISAIASKKELIRI